MGESLGVLSGPKSRDSGLGRPTLPGASCFNALCGHVCPCYRHSTDVLFACLLAGAAGTVLAVGLSLNVFT